MSIKAAPRANKYRNVPKVLDGIRFDSTGESNRWAELCLLQKAGYISGLRRQVPHRLEAQGQLICIYKSDFCYLENGLEITEDFKGGTATMTPEFRLKRRLMQVLLGIDIRITTAAKKR